MSNQDKLKEIVRELIKKEVEEASTSSATLWLSDSDGF